jgi:hypothetical protein
METIMTLKLDDAKFIELIAEKVAEKLRPSLQITEPIFKQEKVYLTRKAAAAKLGITPPTLDSLVNDQILLKLGKGKRGRFKAADIENLYENLDKYYRRPRKNVLA